MDEVRDHAHLPPPARREWLLDRLGDLVERVGVEPLVAWPLIEPDTQFFPDRWDPSDDRTIVRLLRRLLWYAGLDELDVSLHVVDEGESARKPGFIVEQPHSDTVAWYAGIDGDTCLFGVFRSRLTTGDEFVAAMAHEVAHAYRHVHGLAVNHTDTEEQLTDLTTVFLGTGILSTNAAYRYRSSAVGESVLSGHQWEHKRLGYLGHESLAFLLAARCSLAELSPREIARVAALLEPTQRECFAAAVRFFDESDESLLHRLRLPPRARWPEPESVDDLIAWDGSADTEPLPQQRKAVEDAPEFAVARVRDHRYLAAATAAALSSTVGLLSSGEWRAVLLAAPLVALVVGSSLRSFRCGVRGCPDAVSLGQRCPRCGALAISEDHPWA